MTFLGGFNVMQKVLVLHDFMLKDKKLKGSRLLVFAFIYSYSQIPDSCFYVNWKNAVKFLGISKSSYFEAVQWLIDYKYISNDYSLYGYFEYNESDHLTILNGKSYTNDEICKIAQYKWVK